MQEKNEAQHGEIKTLGQSLAEQIGGNDPYPTLKEIATHKKHEVELKRWNRKALCDQFLKDETVTRINTTGISDTGGFYPIDSEIFYQILMGTNITSSHKMGGGVVTHEGDRNGKPIWLLENPIINMYGIWVEENGHFPG